MQKLYLDKKKSERFKEKIQKNSINLRNSDGKIAREMDYFFLNFRSIVGCLRFCKEHEDLT